MMRWTRLLVSVPVLSAAIVGAVDIPVAPKKLIFVDKLATASKAKAVFVAKDPAITKAGSIDPNDISVRFDVTYENGAAAGQFLVPAGASVAKSPGWVVNKETVAKYVNKDAPEGPTGVKVAVIKPGKLLKLIGKNLGDAPLDIFVAGDPGAPGVRTAYCVTAGGEENCHCSMFTGCVYKLIAGGQGAKLVCKAGSPDATCTGAGGSTTSTTSSTSTSTTLGVACGDTSPTCNGDCSSTQGCDGIGICVGGPLDNTGCFPSFPNQCQGALCLTVGCLCFDTTTSTTTSTTSTTIACCACTDPAGCPCPVGTFPMGCSETTDPIAAGGCLTCSGVSLVNGSMCLADGSCSTPTTLPSSCCECTNPSGCTCPVGSITGCADIDESFPIACLTCSGTVIKSGVCLSDGTCGSP